MEFISKVIQAIPYEKIKFKHANGDMELINKQKIA